MCPFDNLFHFLFIFTLLTNIRQRNMAAALQCYVDPRGSPNISSHKMLNFVRIQTKKFKEMAGKVPAGDWNWEDGFLDAKEMDDADEDKRESGRGEKEPADLNWDWKPPEDISAEISADGRPRRRRVKYRKECVAEAKYCAIFQCFSEQLGAGKAHRKCLEMKEAAGSPDGLCAQFKGICEEKGGKGECLICNRDHFCNVEFLQRETDSEEGDSGEYAQLVSEGNGKGRIFSILMLILVPIGFILNFGYLPRL